jgi:peptidoglycan/LPS O-acetylase OafA/YrhL
MLLSYWYHFHRDTFIRILHPHRFVLIVIGALLLLPAFLYTPETTTWIWTFGLTEFYLGSGMILIGSLLCRPQGYFAKSIAFVGANSYSIYLWHMPAIIWVVPTVQVLLKTQFSPVVQLLLSVLCSVAVGIMFSRLIEIPVLRMRDRLFPSMGDVTLANQSSSGTSSVSFAPAAGIPLPHLANGQGTA